MRDNLIDKYAIPVVCLSGMILVGCIIAALFVAASGGVSEEPTTEVQARKALGVRSDPQEAYTRFLELAYIESAKTGYALKSVNYHKRTIWKFLNLRIKRP